MKTMTELLTKVIVDGHRDKVFDELLQKLLKNDQYE